MDRPDPMIKGNHVKVKIHAVPMCTEFHACREGHPSDVLGHEAAGEVIEVAQPGRVEVGDRVVVMPQNSCGKCSLCLSGEHIHCQHPVDPSAVCGVPADAVDSVSLLGSDVPLTWTQDDRGLHVTLPETGPCDHACTLQLTVKDERLLHAGR